MAQNDQPQWVDALKNDLVKMFSGKKNWSGAASINPFDTIHVLAHGFPGAALHPAKAKEHKSMRFTKFRQESGP